MLTQASTRRSRNREEITREEEQRTEERKDDQQRAEMREERKEGEARLGINAAENRTGEGAGGKQDKVIAHHSDIKVRHQLQPYADVLHELHLFIRVPMTTVTQQTHIAHNAQHLSHFPAGHLMCCSSSLS
jgi:hypothetical protein